VRRFLFFTQKRWSKGVEFCFSHPLYSDLVSTGDYLNYVSKLKEWEEHLKSLLPYFDSIRHSKEGLCLRFTLPEGARPLGEERKRGMTLEEVRAVALEVLNFSKRVNEALGIFYSPSTPYALYTKDGGLFFPDLTTEFLLRLVVSTSKLKPLTSLYEFYLFFAPEHFIKGVNNWESFCKNFALFLYYLRYGINPYLDFKRGKLPSFEEYASVKPLLTTEEDPVNVTISKLWKGEVRDYDEVENEIKEWREPDEKPVNEPREKRERLRVRLPKLHVKRAKFPAKLLLLLFFVVVSSPVAYFYATHTRVPDLAGKELWKCYVLGGTFGFKVRVSAEEYSDVYPERTVLSQNPPPRSVIKKGSTVEVTVSKGKEYVELPEVKGKLLSEAEELLKKEGLKVKEIVRLR